LKRIIAAFGGGAPIPERGSLGMAGAAHDGRQPGIARSAAGTGDGAMALPTFPHEAQPHPHDSASGKGPRYGLLVGIVAVISLLVPVTLFVALNRSSEASPPGAPSEPVREIQKSDAPRTKAERGKNGVTVSPSASASASSSSGAAAPLPSAPAAPSASASSHKAPRGGAKR
jgi:hypothetical protein